MVGLECSARETCSVGIGACDQEKTAKEGGKMMIPWIYADLDTIIDSYSEPPKEGKENG